MKRNTPPDLVSHIRRLFVRAPATLLLFSVSALGCNSQLVASGSDAGHDSAQDASATPMDGSTTPMDAALRDAGSLPDASSGSVPDAQVPPVVSPEGFSAQFVWPATGWIGADENYIDGPHSGSADICLPYFTPVGAARSGTVHSAEWTERGGHTLRIDHTDGYRTIYSHLSLPASVNKGDTVVTGETVGYSGRTGNAWRNGAHLHFSIERNGARLAIPDLDIGDWVQRGDAIAGSYGNLEKVAYPGEKVRFDVRVVAQDVSLWEGPSQSTKQLALLTEGVRIRVLDSSSGYYQVAYGDHVGWVPHIGTLPIRSQLTTLRVTAQSANIREDATTNASVVGTASNASLVTALERKGDWYQILYGAPIDSVYFKAVYGWTHESNVEPTDTFSTRIRTTSANVREQPSVASDTVGSLSLIEPITVFETRFGWYRIKHNGNDAWVAGWLTQGPI